MAFSQLSAVLYQATSRLERRIEKCEVTVGTLVLLAGAAGVVGHVAYEPLKEATVAAYHKYIAPESPEVPYRIESAVQH